ncbi:MAG: MoxR family ATPase [Thermodesulfobacteriota bacterium]|nr:MoxR family ATPase [Thermodesulfobacteriota bacterium]
MDYKKQVRVPPMDSYFFAHQEVVDTLDKLEKLSNKHPINILVTGRQGCGKSSLIRQFASVYSRPLAVFQVGLLSEPGQLFGEHSLKAGETYYQEFLFPKAISTPRCVIHLEEINRPEHPKALNELFSVLSEERTIWVDQLGLVEVANDVIFFATMNEGDEFTGTEMLDAALRDRFYIISMDYLPFDIEQRVLVLKSGISEEQADTIIKIVRKLRSDVHVSIPVSTRHSLMMAELLAMGTSLREAVIYSLQISRDILESLLLSVHAETKDMEMKKNIYSIYSPDKKGEKDGQPN